MDSQVLLASILPVRTPVLTTDFALKECVIVNPVTKVSTVRRKLAQMTARITVIAIKILNVFVSLDGKV